MKSPTREKNSMGMTMHQMCYLALFLAVVGVILGGMGTKAYYDIEHNPDENQEVGDLTVNGLAKIPRPMGGVQRITADANFTINNDTSLVVLAVDPTAARTVTLPAATVGRYFKIFLEVEAETSNWAFTCAGSDTQGGNIWQSVEGNGAGDGDVVVGAMTSTILTLVDDVNIGSYVEYTCAVAGQWLVVGHTVVAAVGADATFS